MVGQINTGEAEGFSLRFRILVVNMAYMEGWKCARLPQPVRAPIDYGSANKAAMGLFVVCDGSDWLVRQTMRVDFC